MRPVQLLSSVRLSTYVSSRSRFQAWTVTTNPSTAAWAGRGAEAAKRERRCYRTSINLNLPPQIEGSPEKQAHLEHIRTFIDSLAPFAHSDPSSHPHTPRTVPIIGSDPGHVLRLLSGRKPHESVDREELVRWLLERTFPPEREGGAMRVEELGVWMQAMREEDWEGVKRVLSESDPKWETTTPASILAVLSTTHVSPSSPNETDDVLRLLGSRAALDSSPEEAASSLMGMARVALDAGRWAVLSDVVSYACAYSTMLARLAVGRYERDSDSQGYFDPSRSVSGYATSRDQTVSSTPAELGPILAVMDVLVYTPLALDRTVSHQTWLLLSALASLCRPRSSAGPDLTQNDADDDPSLAYVRWTLPLLGPLDRNRLLRASLTTLRPTASLATKVALSKLISTYDRPLTGTLQLALKVFARPGFGEGNGFGRVAGRLAEVRGGKGESEGGVAGKGKKEMEGLHRKLRDIRYAMDMDLEAKTDAAVAVLMPRIRLIYDSSPSSDSPLQLSVLLLQALNRAGMYPSVELLWRRWTRSGETESKAMPTAALNAALLASRCMRFRREVVENFERHAVPRPPPPQRQSPSVPTQHAYHPDPEDPSRIHADAHTLALYMWALETYHRYTAVWTLYTSLWPTWHVAPDETHLELLLQSARKLTVNSSPHLSGPVLGSPRPDDQEDTRWGDRSACEKAIEVFWETLYVHRPNVGAEVHASLGKLAQPNRWLNRWKGRSVPSPPALRPSSSWRGGEHANVVSALQYDDRQSLNEGLTPVAILPTPGAFKELIELLGMSGLGHEIPVALAWMKALQIERPRPGVLEAAYLWFTHSAPRHSEVQALNDFVAGWIGQDRIPTDEQLAVNVSKRAHAYRFGSNLEKPSPSEG